MQKECISTLQLSANSLLTLINDLLDISKIETQCIKLEQTPFDLRALMNEIIEIQSVHAREKNLHLTLNDKCAGSTCYVGDQVRLKQVLMNLCSNAIKFTDKGSVEIIMESSPSPREEKDVVTVSCVDSGIGIAPENLLTIFEKFVQADSSITRKYGGTGLGLAITKTLVEIMGGVVAVKSRVGEGSTFSVSIPFARATKAESAHLAPDEQQHLDAGQGQPRVLLVEDYPANVLVATLFLEQFGYAYDVAVNGLEAIQKVKEGRDYMAILMDVQMQGMNGIEATQAIRLYEQSFSSKQTPIIGMTAHALAGDKQRCLEGGMNDYIAKPFNPDELFEKLAACRCPVAS
jgi:CheY-like chemotaxis protein